ncbi:HEAT repeat domain-containing protein [bacterium]|nr:HEAT repeat domain-containing protein [bacterium]
MEKKDTLIEQIRDLFVRLESSDFNERYQARRELVALRETRAVAPLISMIGTRSSTIRATVCTTLGNIGDDSALRFLVGCLRDPDKDVRVAACQALDKLGDPISIAPLMARLQDGYPEIRNAAFTALKNIGDGRLARAILNNDIDDLIRIVLKGDPRAVEPLLERIKSENNIHLTTIKRALFDAYNEFRPKSGELLCLNHFTRFAKYTRQDIKIGLLKKLPYYGCRICGRSINALTDIREVVAVLDLNMHLPALLDDGVLEVNYIKHNELFDFDKVEIVNVSDSIFDSFCKKLSLNSNQLLLKKCSEIDCVIHDNCGLSPNKLEIPANIFRNVEHIAGSN